MLKHYSEKPATIGDVIGWIGALSALNTYLAYLPRIFGIIEPYKALYETLDMHIPWDTNIPLKIGDPILGIIISLIVLLGIFLQLFLRESLSKISAGIAAMATIGFIHWFIITSMLNPITTLQKSLH